MVVYLNSPYIGCISIGMLEKSTAPKRVVCVLIYPLYNCFEAIYSKNVSYSDIFFKHQGFSSVSIFVYLQLLGCSELFNVLNPPNILLSNSQSVLLVILYVTNFLLSRPDEKVC